MYTSHMSQPFHSSIFTLNSTLKMKPCPYEDLHMNGHSGSTCNHQMPGTTNDLLTYE